MKSKFLTLFLFFITHTACSDLQMGRLFSTHFNSDFSLELPNFEQFKASTAIFIQQAKDPELRLIINELGTENPSIQTDAPRKIKKSFRIPTLINRQTISHTRERNFFCPVQQCHKKYLSNGVILSHLKKNHTPDELSDVEARADIAQHIRNQQPGSQKKVLAGELTKLEASMNSSLQQLYY